MRTLGLADPAFIGGMGGGVAFDTDAAAYITAVETADGQALETAVADAINAFVVGCKADGIWDAIKACCILAGARTLAGALVPLVGSAPTNFNFVAGDYDRKTGLKGNGITKYLDSNRNNNADPQDSNHNAVYITTVGSTGAYMGATGGPFNNGTNLLYSNITRSRSNISSANGGNAVAGLYGTSRALSGQYAIRNGGSSFASTIASQVTESSSVFVYQRSASGFEDRSDARLAFYSIGEALDLALLDARVTTLINAFAAAIP